MKFSKAKCKVLHVGQGSPKHKLEEEFIESISAGKDSGMLVSEKLLTRACSDRTRENHFKLTK